MVSVPGVSLLDDHGAELLLVVLLVVDNTRDRKEKG
jgi:hypothetical protein